MKRSILLDTRLEMAGRPLALVPVLGRPWIATSLDMIKEADALDRLTVLTAPAFLDEIREIVSAYPGGDVIHITIDPPPDGDHQILEIDQVYIRNRLIRAVRRGADDLDSARLISITSPEDIEAAEEHVYKSTPGHRTPLLLLVYRPASRVLARGLAKLGVSPNSVTLAAFITVPIAAFAIAVDDYHWGLVGALMIQLFTVLDVADGEVARISNQRSHFGHWFDSTVDILFEVSVIAAFGIGAVVSTGNEWLAIPAVMWLVSVVAIHNDNVLEEISWLKEQGAQNRIRPDAVAGSSRLFPVRLARQLASALRQPEIMRGIYCVGLIAAYETGVVLFYAAFYSYSISILFMRSYINYRRNELRDVKGKSEP